MAQTSMDMLPVFDLAAFLCASELERSDAATLLTCKEMAECFKSAGAMIIRDPRCSDLDNNRFLDMMEAYFERPQETKMSEARPQLHYQVGCTPEGIEVPQCVQDTRMQADIQALPAASQPVMPSGPDRKWRYMWRVGNRPAQTSYPELNASPVIPDGFPQWTDVMDNWGNKMIAAVEVVSEMVAIGLGLERSAFSLLMSKGPHLLAPTGSDLGRHRTLGTVLAGYHSDLNFLTIHGRCRFPGLFIWLRDGTKVPVKVPPGCLLLQAGQQIEYLTGGAIKAGMHEVVVSPATVEAVEEAQADKRSLWRVSSTVFSHIASDQVLRPLGHFATEAALQKYPPVAAGAFVESELAKINLKLPATGGRNEHSLTATAGTALHVGA